MLRGIGLLLIGLLLLSNDASSFTPNVGLDTVVRLAGTATATPQTIQRQTAFLPPQYQLSQLTRHHRHSLQSVPPTSTVRMASRHCNGDSDSSHDDDIDTVEGHVIQLDHIEKVWVLSDLHVDNADNQRWLQNRMDRGEFDHTDLLLVAGDISHDMGRMEASLATLLSRNSSVLFLPGNHEAWLSKDEQMDGNNNNSSNMSMSMNMNNNTSFDKLEWIADLCHRMGIITSCAHIGVRDSETVDSVSTSHPLLLCPLHSWYDGTLTIESCEDLCQDFRKWPWVDFIKCNWPADQFPPSQETTFAKIPMGLTEYYAKCNKGNVDAIRQLLNADDGSSRQSGQHPVGVMTVSHFLPNQQCLPDWKDLNATHFNRDDWLDHGGGGMSAKFAKVAGTKLLDDQLRSLISRPMIGESTDENSDENTDENDGDSISDGYVQGAAATGDADEDVDFERPMPRSARGPLHHDRRHIHIFGHSHRPKDFEWKGVRYIHNPLGKPRERDMYMVSPDVDFQLVWDTRVGEIKGPTILRLWEEQGGGLDALRERMSRMKRRKKSRYKGVQASTIQTKSR